MDGQRQEEELSLQRDLCAHRPEKEGVKVRYEGPLSTSIAVFGGWRAEERLCEGWWR